MRRLQRFFSGKRAYLGLFILSLFVAVLSHGFFIVEYFNGKFMTGINDGLSQMLPFKQLLYDEYAQGNFFYSDKFGMGGGTYSQLGYYFSTSIFFIMSVGVTFLLELFGIIGKPDLFYWASTLIPISIIRVTLIIFVTTLYFKYMKLATWPAFIGAVLYGTSVIYFRHVTYWEFFADAMVWLPILLYGVEKIIREGRIGWFVFAIALNMFDNFYFAYINFLLAGIYIVFRWVFSLADKETKIFKQIKMYLVGGFVGFGISAVAFVPAVYGYLNNHRIPYEAKIWLVGTADNPLVDGRVIVIPALVMLFLFAKPFYQEKRFKFFAVLTIFSIVIHFSPMVGSIFNGFSAPQYRWEYFLALVAAGVVATGLGQLGKLQRKNIIFAVSMVAVLYVLAYVVDPFLPFDSWQGAYLVYAALATGALYVSLIWKNNPRTVVLLSIFIVAISLYTSNFFQYVKLSVAGDVRESSLEFMQGDAYIHDDQLEIVREIRAREGDAFYRIDWMTPLRNNTPLVQGFNGFSVYSSILNKELLYFYLYDLEIDMGRESVSRYGTLGNRANLASMLAGKYYIAKSTDKNVPYGFEEVYTVGDYTAYENVNVLPFVRTTSKAYVEEDFADREKLTREQAMLDGVILKKAPAEKNAPPIEEDIFPEMTVEEIGATYSKGILEVTDATGGIDLVMPGEKLFAEDYYVAFNLHNFAEKAGYKLKVNEYTTFRKKNNSIYKTGVEDLTIRVQAAEKIAIRLPKGKYQLTDMQVFAEDYHMLAAEKQASNADIPFVWEKNKVSLTYDNVKNEQYMMLPIPFEKGWELTVNGEKAELLEANYAFMALELEDGENEVKLVYTPPYFMPTLIVSIISVLAAVVIVRRRGK